MSAMTATKSVLCTRTAELYCCPAYMSPEALLTSTPATSISELMAMDIWSLGMIVFLLLNPDIAFPCATEINHRQSHLRAAGASQKVIASQVLPAMSEKYSSMRNLVWQPLESVHRPCAQFNPASRPLANELLNLVKSQCSPVSQTSVGKIIYVQADVNDRTKSSTVTQTDDKTTHVCRLLPSDCQPIRLHYDPLVIETHSLLIWI